MSVSLIHLFIFYYPPWVLLCPKGLNLLLHLSYISFHVKQNSALFPHLFFIRKETNSHDQSSYNIWWQSRNSVQISTNNNHSILCNFRVNFCHRTQIFNCQAVYTPNALIFKYLLSACTAAITSYFMLYYLRCLHNTQNVYKSQCSFGVQKNPSVPI